MTIHHYQQIRVTTYEGVILGIKIFLRKQPKFCTLTLISDEDIKLTPIETRYTIRAREFCCGSVASFAVLY